MTSYRPDKWFQIGAIPAKKTCTMNSFILFIYFILFSTSRQTAWIKLDDYYNF